MVIWNSSWVTSRFYPSMSVWVWHMKSIGTFQNLLWRSFWNLPKLFKTLKNQCSTNIVTKLPNEGQPCSRLLWVIAALGFWPSNSICEYIFLLRTNNKEKKQDGPNILLRGSLLLHAASPIDAQTFECFRGNYHRPGFHEQENILDWLLHKKNMTLLAEDDI